MRRQVMAGLAGVLALVALWDGAARATDDGQDPPPKVDGLWRMTPGTLVVALARCGEDLCGKVAALGKGMARTDAHNPVTAEQGRDLCGLPIMEHLRWDGYAWAGTLYDPQDGTHYTVGLVLDSESGMLNVYGNTGTGEDAMMMRSFGRSEAWTRLQVPPQSCAHPAVT